MGERVEECHHEVPVSSLRGYDCSTGRGRPRLCIQCGWPLPTVRRSPRSACSACSTCSPCSACSPPSPGLHSHWMSEDAGAVVPCALGGVPVLGVAPVPAKEEAAPVEAVDRKKREADAEAEPEADADAKADADPYLFYSTHG